MNQFMRKLPNIITVIRILLIPVFVYVFFYGNIYLALGVYLVAALSDLADGYLARKYNAVSKFGKLMDPFADKALSIVTIICLFMKDMIPLIAIIVLAAKELILIIGGIFLLGKEITVSANKMGKITAFITNTAVFLCFFHFEPTPGAAPYDWYLLYAALVLQIIAMLQYGYQFLYRRYIRKEADPDEK